MNNENPTRLPARPAAPPPSQGEIGRRAYFIWREAGSPADGSQDHWLQAEQELTPDESPSTTPYSASGGSSISGQGSDRG
jgi:hypothetical protein